MKVGIGDSGAGGEGSMFLETFPKNEKNGSQGPEEFVQGPCPAVPGVSRETGKPQPGRDLEHCGGFCEVLVFASVLGLASFSCIFSLCFC